MTRISSKSEFVEKVSMAQELQGLIVDGTATANEETVYWVLMSELKEFHAANPAK